MKYSKASRFINAPVTTPITTVWTHSSTVDTLHKL